MFPNPIRTAGWLIVLTLFLLPAGSARGEFTAGLEVTVTPASGGLTRYEYLLTNPTDSDQGTGFLLIGVDEQAELTEITAPSGWEVLYTLGDTSIAWLTPSLDLDLLPGQAAKFSFLSPLAPDEQDFLILGSDFNVLYGFIAGPSVATSAVPEPSSLILVGLGAAGFLAIGRKRVVRE